MQVSRAVANAKGRATSARAARTAGGLTVDWLTGAIDMVGDIFDPFLPGGAGSNLRPTAYGGDVRRQNIARQEAGLPLISTGARRRRRKALTADDIRIALVIASAISKKAAENFILSRTAAS